MDIVISINNPSISSSKKISHQKLKMIEIRRSHPIVVLGAVINLGSGLLLSFFAITNSYMKTVVVIFGIILLRIAVYIQDKIEEIYG